MVQGIAVHGKMHRNKVQDNTNSGTVAGADQLHQLLCSAVTGGGAEKSGILIAPGAVRRMLTEGHKFDVVIAGLFHIVYQLRRNLRIGVPAVGIVWIRVPGA